MNAQAASIIVGSKSFTEGYVLAEMIAQTAESAGEASVIRKFGMGGTGILAQALENAAIDIYPEYTGTIDQEIAKSPADLSRLHLLESNPLGFNNTYAVAVSEQFAQSHPAKSIADLLKYNEARVGFSQEFVKRKDGLPKLEEAYGWHPQGVLSMEHALAYEAILKNQTDVIDVYSTDAKIKKFNLVTLRDSLHVFPNYEAVFLAREEFVMRFPKTWNQLQKLSGRLTESKMIELNSQVELDKKSVGEVVGEFLGRKNEVESQQKLFQSIWTRTQEHLELVLTSLLGAILVGIPLGIVSTRWHWVGKVILWASSMIQTIPSLALLVFLIPVFGIGTRPALVALFLYALFPIVVNTFLGLSRIDSTLLEAESVLGLSTFQKLRLIELPLASPLILNGVRTSATIGIGTATLAALIGAGGYGAPIVTGLTLNDLSIILQGAIPAAVLALVTQYLFEILERILLPRGLR